MKDNLSRGFGNLQRTFTGFTVGQKVVAIIGTGALLLAGFMVFRWASAPTYAPLYSDLASSDASAIIDQLEASGTPYKLSNGGNTIMVPADAVYQTRIDLSGEGLPAATDSGYSILDNQGLSTSEFQEQTDFKRAMEGELSNTIEAIDGVDSAIVHLAIPQKEVFADEQAPTTASVLVKTRAGNTMSPEQVQAVTNLVSSSVDGLSADNVTVTDSTGKVLSAPGAASGTAGGAAQGQTQQVADFQNQMTSQIQTMLDRVVGPGNSTVQVTPVLNFDKATSRTTRYFGKAVALSSAKASEQLTGAQPNSAASGIVGPDSQTEVDANGTTSSDGDYKKSSETSDNGVNNTVEDREKAPGSVESMHVGIVLDTQALKGRDPAVIQANVAAALGIDPNRGDTIDVSSMAFDRTAENAAAKELTAAEKSDQKAATMSMAKNGGLIAVGVIIVLIAWLQSRKKAKARSEATSYVVEQLRRDALDRASAQQAVESQNAAMLALESAEAEANNQVRDEIVALVDRQPEDVAALLRGWLVEKS